EERAVDRTMRSALLQARKTGDFAHQQKFDRAVNALVRTIPIPPEIAEWFSTEHVLSGPRRTWQRIAQMWVTEKRMQFFLFPAERDIKTGKVLEFSGWHYLDYEGWVEVVAERNGVCFMAALRGRERDLASYLAKSK